MSQINQRTRLWFHKNNFITLTTLHHHLCLTTRSTRLFVTVTGNLGSLCYIQPLTVADERSVDNTILVESFDRRFPRILPKFPILRIVDRWWWSIQCR